MKKWLIRLVSLGFISLVAIVLAVLNPHFLYANKTEIGNYIICHNTELAAEFENRLININAIVEKSELYNPTIQLKICLNDGSLYPELMEKLRGPAFGWGFHNISTFRGTFNFKENTIELNGYKWNLEQLIVHELAHCLQFESLGLFNSNPMGNHPDWKWEGYAEYVSRKSNEQLSLTKNIQRIESAKKEAPDAWGVFFDDGTVAPRVYYGYWLLVQYSLDIKKMSYLELLDSQISKDEIEKEMIEWYRNSSVNEN